MQVEIANRMGFVLVTSSTAETPSVVVEDGAYSVLDRAAWLHTLKCNPLLSVHIDAGRLVIRELDAPAPTPDPETPEPESTKPGRRRR